MPRSDPTQDLVNEDATRNDPFSTSGQPTVPTGFNPGDIFGDQQAYANRSQAFNQRKSMDIWSNARGYAPTAKSLSDPYNYSPDMQGLQDIANSHGLTEGTKSAYQGMQQQTGQQAAAQRGAIQQQMVARGMGQSGLDYAAQLQAGQAGADASAMGGFQAVAQGEQARNAAIGQMAGIKEHQQGAYADAQSQGLEQVYNNYMQLAAGATGQYSQGSQQAAQRGAAAQQSQGQFLSSAIGLIGAFA